MAKPNILITFDSMKNPNSGLYSFGKSLGDEIIKQNHNRFSLSYYLHRRSAYRFGSSVTVIYLSKLHKLFFPQYKQFRLVHFTDQYCRLKPAKVNAIKILTIHDMNPVHEKFRSARRMAKYLNRLRGYIASCDKIVAISRFVASDIAQYFPQAAGKIAVIYNGAEKLQINESHIPAFKPSGKFLFTIGYVGEKKNFHVLPALLQENDYTLVIAGVLTPYTEKIMSEAARFGCTDRVVIAGPVSEDDKAWYFKNCEAFLFPSIAEGFGLPVIEAMHFGKPVFLSKFTSLPEVGGDSAYYFDSFEPEQMLRVFGNGMKDFTENNRAVSIMKYAARFSWETSAKQYLQLYEECLANR